MANNFNFICLDAARMQGAIAEARKINASNESLYKGTNEELLSMYGPFIFSCNQVNDFNKWFLENGWGKSWGVVINAPGLLLYDLFVHFRKFLKQKNESGVELFFRFYDPRVLKVFLAACNEQELKAFFGPVEKFIVECDDSREAIAYTHDNGILKQQNIPVELIFGAGNDSAIPAFLPVRKRHNIIIEEDLLDEVE